MILNADATDMYLWQMMGSWWVLAARNVRHRMAWVSPNQSAIVGALALYSYPANVIRM